MEPLVASISLSAAFVALCFAGFSLFLHFVRRKQPPEVAEVWTAIQEARTQHLDLLDKVEHWRRRDSVRRARQGAEEKAGEVVVDPTPQERKLALRRKATAAGLNIAE